MISLLAGMVTIWLIYLVGVELFSRRVALWGAGLAAICPYLVWYSRDATDYAWLIAVSTASFYLLVRSAKRGGWKNWTGFVLATIAALFSHYYAAVLLVAELPVYFLVADWRRQLRPWLASEAAIGLALIPWLFYNRGASTWAAMKIPDIVAIIKATSMAPVTYVRGYAGLSGSGAATIFPDAGQARQLIAVFAIIFSLFLFLPPLRKAFFNKRVATLAIYTFLVVAIPVFLQYLRGETVAGRYYAIAAPGFILLLAVLMAASPPRVAFIAVYFWFQDSWGCSTTSSFEHTKTTGAAS